MLAPLPPATPTFPTAPDAKKLPPAAASAGAGPGGNLLIGGLWLCTGRTTRSAAQSHEGKENGQKRGQG